ncbi:MAG: diguanylate cyclase domain-containing protein, partial [Burkholderiales bacterium]
MSKSKESKEKDAELKRAKGVREDIVDTLDKMTKNVPGVVYQFLMRPDGSFCFPYASSTAYDILRVDRDDLRDNAFIERNVHPDDVEPLIASIHASARDLTLWKHEYRRKFDDGTERWFLGTSTPQRQADSSVLWHGFIVDITERKAEERAITESRNLLQTIINTAPLRIFWKDKDLNYLGCNPLFARDAGKSCPEELIGKNDYQMGWAAQADAYRNDDISVIESGIPRLAYEEPQTAPDGRLVWLSTSKVPLRNQKNEVIGVLGVYDDITGRKQIEAELRATRNQMEATLQALPDTLFELGLDGAIHSLYTRRPNHNSMSAQELIGKKIGDVFASHVAETIMSIVREADINGQSHGKQYKCANLQGSDTWFELSAARKPVYSGEGQRFVMLLRDITERKLAEEESRIASAAFQSQQPMIITDAHSIILRVNQAFVDSTGYTAEEALGKTPRLFKSDRHSADFFRAMWESINLTGGWQGEIWDRRKNGEIYPKWMVISAVKDADGKVTHYIGTHVDISERKKTEQRIESLAFFDQLTGVPNRTLLLDRLKQSIVAGSRSGSHGALLFIDLDHFKTLNDTLGHAMGDLLLKQVAQRLAHCVREGDTVARLGGDEFVVILAGLGADERGAAASAKIVAEKILDALSQPYPLGDVAHRSTASIGITLFGVDPVTADELMMQADLAMYRSKAAGRNAMHFFDSHMESEIKERAALEVDLLRAIEEKQFLLHYQAQNKAQNMSDSRVTGVEVLVRWLHPQRGLVSPAEFIPLAEETGLILPLGQWVLETACTQLAIWAAQPAMAHLTVAVNVSARQFRQANFVDQVLA